MAISHPDAVLAAREAANREGSDLILDNLTSPPHPTHAALGTLGDRLRDLNARDGLIESEEVSEDGRDVSVTFWLEADS